MPGMEFSVERCARIFWRILSLAASAASRETILLLSPNRSCFMAPGISRSTRSAATCAA